MDTPESRSEAVYRDNVQASLDAINAAEEVLSVCIGLREWIMGSLQRTFGPISTIKEFID
jgi:hypothetical protein